MRLLYHIENLEVGQGEVRLYGVRVLAACMMGRKGRMEEGQSAKRDINERRRLDKATTSRTRGSGPGAKGGRGRTGRGRGPGPRKRGWLLEGGTGPTGSHGGGGLVVVGGL
jgi:hypothetical protein